MDLVIDSALIFIGIVSALCLILIPYCVGAYITSLIYTKRLKELFKGMDPEDLNDFLEAFKNGEASGCVTGVEKMEEVE